MAGQVVRGVLRVFASGTYLADVEQMGANDQYLSGVRVSRGIAAGELVAGRVVAVALYEDLNPDAGMVVGVWA